MVWHVTTLGAASLGRVHDAAIPGRRHCDLGQPEAETGQVVQAYRDGEDCLKCLRLENGKQVLWSFNEMYPPFPADDWAIKGVAVARIRYGRAKMRHYVEANPVFTWADRNEPI